jgi:hypothetical protein
MTAAIMPKSKRRGLRNNKPSAPPLCKAHALRYSPSQYRHPEPSDCENQSDGFVFQKPKPSGGKIIMAKTIAEKIEIQKAEIQQKENELKLLLRRQKEADRKARTNRLCKRHGLFESFLEGTIPLTEDNIKLFLEKTVANEYGRRTLAALKAAQEKETAAINADAAARSGAPIHAKSTNTAQNGGSTSAEKRANSTLGSGAVAATEAGEPPKPNATS